MFTGIVEELGTVRAAGLRTVVRCRTVLSDSVIGASVAVNGVCLTVVENDSESLSFDLSEETLGRTTLGRLGPGDSVNLERPLTLASRLGGHLVQGHVDAVGRVVKTERDHAGGCRMQIAAPESLRPYIVEKGSVAVDGVSLTVASLSGGHFWVALIPHTLAVTTMGQRGSEDAVNLEVDVMARYVESLMRRET